MTLHQAVISFALVAGLVTITPGLDTAIVLRSTLRGGRRAGILTTLGVNAGVLCWGLAAALGVSALLAASSIAYDVLRYVGTAYLLWLGGRLLWSATRRRSAVPGHPTHPHDDPHDPHDPADPHDPRDPHGPADPTDAADPAAGRGTNPGGWANFRTGLLTNLLNPKVGAFYVAMLPQFLPDDVPPAAMGALLALVHNAEGLLFLGTVTLLAGSFRRWLTRPGVNRSIDGITGAVLVGFGARLALTR